MKKIGILIFIILSFTLGKAQTTIITDDSTYTPLSFNAIMEVHSANGNKGILIPRLTTAERTAISTSATNDISLLVYDTDAQTFWYFDGSAWVEIATGGTVTDDQLLTFSNDTLYIENGNSVYLGDYMELPATAVNGQVLTWNGTAWVAQNPGSGADNWGTQVVVSDATLTGDGTSGSPLGVVGVLTDDQNISGSGFNISTNVLTIGIENGSSETVDLSSLQDGTGTDDQNIQNLGLSGTTLTVGIENGTSQTVDLSSLQDGTGTDDQNIQNLGLSGTTLTVGIENGTSQTVDLSSLQDGTGTDDQNIQNLGLSGTTLTVGIENGTSQTVDLSSLQDGTGTDDQNISGSGLLGTTLTIGIENGTNETVDLSSLVGTDDQNISGSGLVGNILTIGIENGTNETVDLSSFGNDWKLTGNAATSSDFIGTTNNADFKIRTNNSERMTIESNGNVGIGTTAPASKLQVTGGTRIIYSTSPTLYLENNANSASNYALQIQSQGGTRSWIASNGRGYFADRVGIGTTAPAEKLDVSGNIRFSGDLLPDGSAGISGQVLTSQGSGTSPIWQSASNTLYNQVFQKFGTASSTISSSTFVVLSNLTQTVTLTGPAKVLIMTDGGIQTTSTSTSGYSSVDIVLNQNGSWLPDGAFKRITAANNGGLVSQLAFWSMGVILDITAAGTYTWDVRSRLVGGSNATVNGDNTSVLEGSLYILVIYQ